MALLPSLYRPWSSFHCSYIYWCHSSWQVPDTCHRLPPPWSRPCCIPDGGLVTREEKLRPLTWVVHSSLILLAYRPLCSVLSFDNPLYSCIYYKDSTSSHRRSPLRVFFKRSAIFSLNSNCGSRGITAPSPSFNNDNSGNHYSLHIPAQHTS